ncbi:MupA/Atu3671 family FMN-dependent luciferase-like monooxygenase [Tritonibacter horizontis]|uniref:Dimodular nonribosomal peptide synthase n=1 Tax=Tritonibacter horizontis TaxID=1768241 RepID=A0A132BVN1_9RHOB|nr:MupA/Atu3671 family FMN-dependent luciferase-like monooxygenase [Tritonibacter horizontis]KUP92423.1 dimodular nonribosomal peptide synthase [Tritonibacter horizontis]
MTAFSTIVIGNESLLIGCGDSLLARGHDVRAVVSDNPDVLAWARDKGLVTLSDPKDITGPVDWLFSIANLRVLSAAVLGQARLGAVNFHDGPLPERAGLNTPNWAIIEGATEHGITWHLIEGGVDEGDILAQRRFALAPDETAFSLNSKCYGAALDSFGDVLDQLETGVLDRQPQDLSHRRYHARADRPAGGGLLRFDRSAAALSQLVRGLDMGGYWNPLTTAKVDLGESLVIVGKAAPTVDHGPAGQVLAVTETTLTVACAEGAVVLSDIRTLQGGPVIVSDLLQTGTQLPIRDAARCDAIESALRTVQRAEPFWRRQLAEMQPLPLPLAQSVGRSVALPSASGETGSKARIATDITLPAALPTETLLALILTWALRSTGEASGTIALTLHGAADTDPGVINTWAPLNGIQSETLADLRARMAQVIRHTAEGGGFATDLMARAPEVSPQATPAISVCLEADVTLPDTLLAVQRCGHQLRLSASADHLSAEALDLLAARLSMLLAIPAPSDAQPLQALPMLPEAERKLMLEDWNATGADAAADQTIHGAIKAQALRTPAATAVVFEDQSLTYAELDRRANALAHHLHAQGISSGSHVGVYLRRSMDLVVATLGILKAGAAYVPLDPAYPADRIAHFVTDSGAEMVITQSGLLADLPDSAARSLCIDTLDLSMTAPSPLPAQAGGDDLAYLIYTSGSTGVPKGVMVRHRNVANFFVGMDACIPHAPGDSWLAVTSLSFDISVLELFWTLARGFKLVLSSDESRLQLANGPIAVSDRKMDFNLFYWGNDDGAGEQKYHLLLEGAKFADAHGFNAVWTPERHFHAFGGPYPNPAVTGAAVAAVTNRIGVRAGSCVAPLHHPARIAEEWAVIDNLTGGRAGIGFASGWQPDDFVLRPENTPPANKAALFETLETVRRLWRGEAVEFARQDGSPHSVVTQPRPVSPELPVWITTAGNPDTWREAGHAGANVLTHLLGQSIEEVGQKIQIYHAALREAGHDPADFAVTLMLHSYLADTRAKARAVAREPMKDYLRSAAGLIKQYAWAFPAFKKPKGVENPFQLDLASLDAEELEAILDFAFERYFEESGLFGTIDDALLRVEQLKQIGVDEIACLIDYGIAPNQVLEGLKPLAEVLRISNRAQELAPEDHSLAAQILRHGVSHLQCTPSMARMIATDPDAGPVLGRLRHLLVGGEALPGDLLAELRRRTPAQIHNMYGPTETTIWSTVETLTETPSGIAPIGRPIANTSVYVLDPQDQPVPVGAAGELCIGGDGVTAGYWQRAALTAERFPNDPFRKGSKMYRTGDLVRWRVDGRLEFLGRTDHQVKIRGQRIELGEIEARLAALEGITAAVVVPRRLGADDQLVAYVTANAPLSETAIKAQLSKQLSDVMVPTHVVTLKHFPLTPNKKIDRKALPPPQPRQAPAATNATPAPAASEVQQAIAGIWQQLLGVATVQPTDNFFALGGHSLLAVQAHRDIRRALATDALSITDIFRFPSLGGLAAHVEQLTTGGATKASPSAPAPAPEAAASDKSETMSKRRAMRASRKARNG